MTKRQEEIIKIIYGLIRQTSTLLKLKMLIMGVDFMFLPVKKGQKTEIGRSIATTLIT